MPPLPPSTTHAFAIERTRETISHKLTLTLQKRVWHPLPLCHLQLNPRAQYLQELSNPGRVRRPGRSRDQVAIRNGLTYLNSRERTTCTTNLWTNSWISATCSSIKNPSGS